MVRFNAETCAAQLLPAAQALGLADRLDPAAAAVSLANHIGDLTAQMDMPQRLRDAGLKEASLAELAGLAFQNHTVHNNPRPIPDAGTIESLLHAAW